MMKLFPVVLCGLMLGCPSEANLPTVRVDLKTDYVPFVEFDAVRMQVGDGDVAFRVDRVVESGEDYLRGQRINEALVQAGEHPITLTLFSAGSVVARRRVSAIVQAPITVVTIVLTRNCEGVTCPNDNPALESCLGGRCVDPRCTPQTPDFCPSDDQCTDAAECPVPAAECVESRCDVGVCLAVPNDALCEDGNVCHGLRGCIGEEPQDAGSPDAGVLDAGMLDVFDAGEPDVFDGGPADVGFDAGPPSACDPPDPDTIFLFTFEDESDDVTGQNGVAENSVLEPGETPCGGSVLHITNDGSPSSHFRVPNRAGFELTNGSIDFYFRGPPVGLTHDILGRDAQDRGAGHFSVSVTESNEIVVRSQSVAEEFYTCSNPITFGAEWHRIGVNFGSGGMELWIDGVRQMRSGTVMYQSSMFACNTGPNELNLVGNNNPFVVGALQIFSDEGSHLPLSRPYNGLEVDQLRLSTVRRDYESEVRP